MSRVVKLLALAWCAVCLPLAAQERLSHGRFRDVTLYRPQGEVRRFVLLLSGENGWDGAMQDTARKLADRGAMVAGIDTPQLSAALAADARGAVPDGDLENLSHYLQGYARLPTYHTPLLVGYSSGASLAHLVNAHAPSGTFLGALSLDGAQGAAWQARFLDAYDSLRTPATLPPPPATLADLPIVEVRAAQPAAIFAILLSGDGGWAGLDKDVARALAQKGVDVVGVDSLRYFWKPRTPQSLADDVDRIVRYYSTQWRRKGVVLIGYSQGADVLPFAFNRLPPASRNLVIYSVLMGPGKEASFEFHVGDWFGGESGDIPIRPEAEKLRASRTLCVYGKDEQDSLCPLLPHDSVEARVMPRNHHFDGAYDELASLILERIAARATR